VNEDLKQKLPDYIKKNYDDEKGDPVWITVELLNAQGLT